MTRPCVRPRQATNHATTCPASRQHHHWCSNGVGRQWRNWELGGPWTNIQVKPRLPFSYLHSFCSLSTPSTVASRLLCRCVSGTILARPTRRSQSCSPRDRGLGLGLGTAGLSLLKEQALALVSSPVAPPEGEGAKASPLWVDVQKLCNMCVHCSKCVSFWGTSYYRPHTDPYLTPPVTKSWRRHCSAPLPSPYLLSIPNPFLPLPSIPSIL